MTRIAIHDSRRGFHPRWVDYCRRRNISYRLVDCRRSDVIRATADCDAVMWHHTQMDGREQIAARAILTALEQAGKVVFPDFSTAWHFDDKLAQKYLMEALDFPMPETEVFLDRDAALEWTHTASFPQVFKLRGGAGATNVRLVETRAAAEQIICRAFARGFPVYDPWGSLKERWRRYRAGLDSVAEPLKGMARFVRPPEFARTAGRERGYALFQDYVPNNDHDIRVIVIGHRAFAIKRMVREHDFRASGSGQILYDPSEFRPECVELAFDLTNRLGAQCIAFDFVFDEKEQPLVLEISYGFEQSGYDPCPGYWDRDLQWHDGHFRPQDWMVESVIHAVEAARQRRS